MNSRNVRGGLAVLLGMLFSVCTPAPAIAAADPLPDLFATDSLANREHLGQSENENIDTFTGVLTLSYADVVLPGNGGFDLKVVRSYRSDRVTNLSTIAGAFGPIPYPFQKQEQKAGVGWTVHFGRVIRESATVCVNQGYVSFPNPSNPQNPTYAQTTRDNPQLELPDGSLQQLIFTATGSPLMVTAQRWKADCLGDGLAIYSPDGIRYDMTQKVTEPNGQTAWYTTRIADRNGNSATVSYVASGSPEISSVVASDGRSIAFTYLDSGLATRRLGTISTGGRVWTFGYLAQPSATTTRYFLTSVTRPDAAGTAWRYSYQTLLGGSGSGPCGGASPQNSQLTGITTPSGGAIAYGYSCWRRSGVTNPSTAVGIGTKSTSDGGLWTFVHALGSDSTSPFPVTPPPPQSAYDTTTVNGPTSKIVYAHYAVSHDGYANPAWAIGLMVTKTICNGQCQSETFTWDRQLIGYESSEIYVDTLVNIAPFVNLQPGIYAPLRIGHSILRDGTTYQTNYSNHDAYGNPQTITESGPNGGARTTNLTYYIDPAKWIVKQVDDETTVGVGSVIRGWDANGNLLSESRDGVTTSYMRYPSGDIGTMTKPRGLVSTFSNYKRGIAQNESHPEGVNISRTVSDAGNITSVTNGEGQTTGFGYEPLDRLVSIIPPIGNPTTIAYTATTKTATRGALQQVETVDGFGRTTNVTTGGAAIAAGYDPEGRKTFGSIVGFPTVGHTFLYDTLNRVTRITHNADASYRTFPSGPATLAVRDERGYVTTHSYRAYGDPDQQLLMAITAPEASANITINRNGRGQVTSATQGGFTRTFGYDTRYYLTSTIHPEVGTTVYGRDAAGNMTTRQVTAGPLGASGITTYDYDGRNRLWRVTYPNGSPSTVTNTYWRTDKLKTAVNAAATRSYAYDSNQNLKTESLVADGLTLAATYNYNPNDQLSSIVYPALSHSFSFDPDVLGRPRSVIAPTGSMLGVGFWPNGQIADIAYAGGSRVTYGQNTREWLNAVTVKTGDGVSRIASTLTHDVAGNLIGVSDSVDATYNRTLTHDAINRLATVSGPWGAGTLGYDGNGNIRSYALGGTTRTYGYDTTRNRLSSVTSVVGSTSTVTSYGYDIYGNASPSATPYVYDQSNNLQTAAGRSYSYDATNKRVKTVANGITTYEFRNAQGLLLAEWKKEPGHYDTLKEHLHVAGKEVAEQQTYFLGTDVLSNVGWMFLQHDASGSVISSTWGGGGLLFKENYQPYGSQINGTAVGYTQRAFAGQRQDAPDLIYMGARYYNPQIGRFLSVDPKEADPSDLHSLNRYAYANNNPYRYVDPDGYTPLDLAFFAVDAVRLGVAIFNGADVKGAAIDLAMSAVGVVSPVVGSGEVLKAIRAASVVVSEVKGADNALNLTAKSVEAAKGIDKMVYRLGESSESATRLGRKSAEAEQVIGHHGVSVSTTKPPTGTPCSSASCSSLEARGFEVRPTPTRNDPNHHTVVLPKPVTKEVANDFNSAFGRE